MRLQEVEAKAWLNTQEEYERVLNYCVQNGEFLGEKHKSDIYFCKKGSDEIAFRIRKEAEKIYVTQKIRTYSAHDVEMNDELEFPIENAETFTSFLKNLEYLECTRKEKRVLPYVFHLQFTDHHPVKLLIEIVHIDTLGRFLEVEILCANHQVKEAEKMILQVFKTLKLEKNREKKPYFLLQKECFKK